MMRVSLSDIEMYSCPYCERLIMTKCTICTLNVHVIAHIN